MRRRPPRPACTVRRAPSAARRALFGAALAAALAAAALGGAPEADAPAPSDDDEKASPVYPASRQTLERLLRRDPLTFLRRARAWAIKHIDEYTCRFQRLERVDGKLQKPEKTRMKFRAHPFSVYMKWIADPSKGQEVIYVDGRHKGKIQVHPSGILGVIFRRVALDPKGKTARKHSRRPITMAGMVNMIRLVTRQCEEAYGRGHLTLTYEGVRVEAGRPVFVLKRVLPPDKGYPCETLVIFIDTETLACVRTDAYNWDGELISHYFYTDIDLDPDLTDHDFDPDNPEYDYRLF